jgi:hypothetical protein
VNLDRRDGNTEFVSDMLVLQTSANHVENAKLLGCEKRQLTQQVPDLGAGAPGYPLRWQRFGTQTSPSRIERID